MSAGRPRSAWYIMALATCLLSCGGETKPPLRTGVVATLSSCEQVELSETVGHPGPWLETSNTVFGLTTNQQGALQFQAPSVARERTFVIRSLTDGSELSVVVKASEAADSIGLAPGCAPFEYGVASGDPTGSGVLLWTRAQVDAPLTWRLSTKPDFSVTTQSGQVTPTAERDHTVTVSVADLKPDTVYFYRFETADGQASAAGRTRTAGALSDQTLRFALVSCSSLFSGYFTGYAHIAARDDINLVIHLGDYIYDFVDKDEEIRIPTPAPTEPDDLASHRARHALYLLDPDLRAARGAHPWFVLWDNHDLEYSKPPDYEGGARAFREWVPMAEGVTESQVYRRLDYGELASVWLVDALLHKKENKLPGSEEMDMLGAKQWAWLSAELTNSVATWKVIGNQKLFSPFQAPVSQGGSTWKAYPESRERLLQWLKNETSGNSLFISGDAHFTVFSNLLDNSKSAISVELLGASLTRGNVDETISGGPDVFGPLTDAFMQLNPHFADVNLFDHGYGLVEVTAEQATAQMLYFPILKPGGEVTEGPVWTVEAGAPQWRAKK